LREQFRLTGTKVGCEQGECGSCTVHRDGRAVYACLILLAECDGGRIETIESLPDAHPIVTALVAEDALQCGYCTPGQVMSILALLEAVSRRSAYLALLIEHPPLVRRPST